MSADWNLSAVCVAGVASDRPGAADVTIVPLKDASLELPTSSSFEEAVAG